MFDLVGVGNPVYDSIITPLSRTDGRVLSGCSTNACLAAKKLGLGRVGLVGCVGSDYVKQFKDDMSAFGIQASVDTSGKETGGFHLIYDERGDRTLDVLGVAGKISARSFSEEFLQSRVIIIGPILGEVDRELIGYLRSSTSSKLFLDPQGLIRNIGPDNRVVHACDKAEFTKIIRAVDFVKPNEPESRVITGESDPVLALRRLHEMGAKVPIVTLADRGSLLLEGGELKRIPPFATRAIDPTGAGDVYGGSFVTRFLRKGSLVDAALFASAAASIKVEQVGPRFLLSEPLVLERMNSIRSRVVTERLA